MTHKQHFSSNYKVFTAHYTHSNEDYDILDKRIVDNVMKL